MLSVTLSKRDAGTLSGALYLSDGSVAQVDPDCLVGLVDRLRIGRFAETERLTLRPENIQGLGAKLIRLTRGDLLFHHPGHFGG